MNQLYMPFPQLTYMTKQQTSNIMRVMNAQISLKVNLMKDDSPQTIMRMEALKLNERDYISTRVYFMYKRGYVLLLKTLEKVTWKKTVDHLNHLKHIAKDTLEIKNMSPACQVCIARIEKERDRCLNAQGTGPIGEIEFYRDLSEIFFMQSVLKATAR